eukprot:7755846-Pyramimonas_sp.AAC.1
MATFGSMICMPYTLEYVSSSSMLAPKFRPPTKPRCIGAMKVSRVLLSSRQTIPVMILFEAFLRPRGRVWLGPC